MIHAFNLFGNRNKHNIRTAHGGADLVRKLAAGALRFYNHRKMHTPQKKKRLATIGKTLLVLLAGSMLAIWLALTPEGLLGKADAIAYAVCHRIVLRSFFLGDRQIPLCARCSGMYLGLLVGLLYQLPFGRRAKLPPPKILAFLGILFLAFTLDGINSYLHLFPGAPTLYPPHNALRLATGTGLGLALAFILLPVANQTLWRDAQERAIIERWTQLPAPLLIAALAAAALYSQNTLLLYPLALVSTLVIPLVLTLCYSLLGIIFFHRENTYNHLRDAWVPLVSGFIAALLQIGLVDWLRFILTNTWGGFEI